MSGTDHPRLIIADRFINALTEAGLVPRGTTRVDISATIGDPVTIDYTIFGDERLLAVAPEIKTTDDPLEAGTAR